MMSSFSLSLPVPFLDFHDLTSSSISFLLTTPLCGSQNFVLDPPLYIYIYIYLNAYIYIYIFIKHILMNTPKMRAYYSIYNRW